MSTSLNSIIILLPTGHRQTLKVQLDTSIVEILEDVCKKNGLKSEDYDLRHHNQILSPTSVIRFCSLPNNAFLEMVPCREQRKDALITLSIQIDNQTERINGSFMPTVDLESVLKNLCPSILEDENKVPVVVFMRREIAGLDKLQHTTLRSLGINSGRVLFRVTTRDSLRHPSLQSTGSVSLSSTRNSTAGNSIDGDNRSLDREREKPESVEKSDTREHGSIKVILRTSPKPLRKSVTIEDTEKVDDDTSGSVNEGSSVKRREEAGIREKVLGPSEQQDRNNFIVSKAGKSAEDRLASAGEKSKHENRENVSAGPASTNQILEKRPEFDLSKVSYLDDERKGLVFPLKDSHSGFETDVPDDFFDITLEDVKLMMRDLKRTREDMENMPLQTGSLRDEEQRRKSEQYKEAIVRIQFPDRIVLQAVFNPFDSIATLMDYVKRYLKDPDMQFYLYTTPPKRILLPEETLLSVECVPCSKIYFGYPNQSQDDMNQGFLINRLNGVMTSQSVASIAACYIRGIRPNTAVRREANQDAAASQSIRTSTTQQGRDGALPKGQVPKWFKPV